MATTPNFGFRDVLRAPAYALSAKQILIMTISLLVSLAIYNLFTYLAFWIDGADIGRLFSAWGFFPFATTKFSALAARACYWGGAGMSVLGVMLGFLGVAAINIETIRGNRFLSAGQAMRFAVRRFPQILLAEASIALFVALIVVIFSLLGLVSRIPWVGDWLYTIFFALPNFIIALFAIFIIFVFSLTVLLLPAVAAAERKGETFSAILETFSTIILQPIRWAGYTLYSFVSAKICGFVFAYFVFRAVQFLTWSSTLGGGERVRRLVESSLAHLPLEADLVRGTFYLVPNYDFGVDVHALAGVGSRDPITYLMAFMLFVIFLSIVSYMLTVIAAAQAYGYVALRQMKDGYSVADEEPLFFTDEPVNDPVEGSDNDFPSAGK